MTSTIDPTVPATESDLTSEPIRDNFLAAYNDINGIETTLSGLGNMSTQSQNNVTITGGAIAGSTLNAGTVANAALANMAAQTVKGSIAGGVPADLSKTQLTTLVNTFTSGASGAVPASGGGTTNFLRADGAFAAPSGGSVTSVALTGDGFFLDAAGSPITSSGTITLSQADHPAYTLAGNPTGIAGVYVDVEVGPTLAFSGNNLRTSALTGDVTASANSFATTIANSAVTTAKINNAAVTNAKLQTQANLMVLSNISGITASPSGHLVTDILDAALGNDQGDILYRGLSEWAVLPAGDDGQALITHGPSTNPTWEDVPGTGTVTSVTLTGDGIVLSSTPSAAVTTNGTLSATLANAGAKTVLANPTASSAAPIYTSDPVVSGHMTAQDFISTVTTGIAPLTVASTTQVANLNAATAGTATNTTNTAITNDNSTNAPMYVTWVTANTGNLPQKVSSGGLTFNPAMATLTAAGGFVGDLTGDVTGNVSGNAGTATALQNARLIGGASFNGTANIVPTTIVAANEGTDTTCFPAFFTDATGNVLPKTNAALTFNSNTVNLSCTTFTGSLAGSISGNAATATALQNARTIGGVSFDGTQNITVSSATGGFTVSGGDLALAANNLTMTGSLGATGARLTKGWFTDLQVTNAIAGSVTGNAATATALLNARTIGGVSFDGTVNIVPQTIESANEATDTTCFPLFVTASGTQQLQPKNNTGLTYNSNTNALACTTFTGAVTGNASTATALATPRAIYGNNFDGTVALTQIIASTFGGTGNGFAKFSGPSATEKTFTLPNASATVLTDNTAVTVPQGGTGAVTLTSDALLKGKGTSAVTATGITVDDTTNAFYGFKAKINNQTGTTYTLDATDTGKIVNITNGSAITLTLPSTLGIGFTCTVVQGGAGAITFTAGSGATLHQRQGNTKTAGLYAITTVYVDTNAGGSAAVYILGGDTAA